MLQRKFRILRKVTDLNRLCHPLVGIGLDSGKQSRKFRIQYSGFQSTEPGIEQELIQGYDTRHNVMDSL
jgi:hypothetical protein